MKTTISKQNFLKTSTLAFAFFLTLILTSCSENSEGISSGDTALIDKIEATDKITIDNNSLPVETNAAFNSELSDSFIKDAKLAVGLGYKVSIFTDNESREEATSDVYFSVDGRQLNDTDEPRRRRRHKCFEFVFPIDFIMPDDSSITLNSQDDWTLIRDWYDANPDVDERPELVFPVDITLKEDGSTQTLIDRDELRAVKDSCKRGKDKRKCFKLVLPVSFTMPDASVITVNVKEDFRLIRRWHIANPDVDEKGSLNFPVDIEYRDGTITTIADETEMQTAKDNCRD